MAVGYRSSSTSGTTDAQGTSRTVPVPAGAAAGDIVIICLEMWQNSGDPTVTYPAGFTEIVNIALTGSGPQKLNAAWKRLTGSDAGTYSMSWTGTQWNQAQAICITGALASGDPVDFVNTATSASGTSVPSTSGSATGLDFLVHLIANENSCTKTPPTGHTEVQDANYLETNYKIATGTGTQTASGGTLSTSSLSLAALIAIKPAAGGPATVTGVLAASSSLTATVVGKRTVKAVTAAASSLTGTVVGKRTVKGTAVASSTLAAAVSAKRKVLGAAVGTSGLAAVVSGASIRTGTASASSGLAAVAVATRSVTATVAASLSLSAVAGGVRTVLGTAVAGSTLTGSGSGQHGVSGTASAVSALVASATGVRSVRGSSASGSALTATISGVVVSPGTGAALAGSSLTATATGVRTVVGAAGAGSALVGSASGTVDSGGATVTGTASAALSLAGQAVGVRTVTGSAMGIFGASATLLGQRTVTGVLIADLIFLAVAFSPPPPMDGSENWLTLEDLMTARDDQNSIMFDRVRLYHDEHTDGAFDPDLGYETTEMPEPYYDGPARVQARPVQSGSRITGEQAVTALGYAVAIPWDVTEARPSDIVEVYQAEYEPVHVGKRLRILDVQSSTYVTARRMSCVGYQERSPA